MTLFSAGLSGLAVAATVFLAASTATTPGRWIAPLRSTSTGNAYVQGDVTPISPKISGYVTAVAIRDNQAVKAGDVLFTIDDSDYRARVDQAAAGVATRRAMLGNLASRLAQQHAVIEQAVAALRGAEAEAHRAALDLARFRELMHVSNRKLGESGLFTLSLYDEMLGLAAEYLETQAVSAGDSRD